MKQLFLMEWGCEAMVRIFDEDNLRFDFTNCPIVAEPVQFGDSFPGVDFIAETEDLQYYIEVKDFQNPKAPEETHKENHKMLIAATKSKKEKTKDKNYDDISFEKGANFCLKIGQKIRDSIIYKYGRGEKFAKRVVFIVVINLESLGQSELGNLKNKINGYIPTWLNSEEFVDFKSISFDLVNAEQLNKSYRICCSPVEM